MIKYFIVIVVIVSVFSFAFKRKENNNKAYAILISVPEVDNGIIQKKYKLPPTSIFEKIESTNKDVQKIQQILQYEGYLNSNIYKIGDTKENPATHKEKSCSHIESPFL